ncbi:MAG: T9SS type A sorting domain-containing protein [Flavobacteriales bacterium]|nr:T9SS type A sorting domain-containing protein [Flavobacteriales bacterium]
MKSFINILFCLLTCISMYGQQTFNLRYPLTNAGLAHGLVEVSDGYIVSADLFEDLRTYSLLKINESGELDSIHQYSDTLGLIGHFYRTIQETQNDQILDVVFSVDPNGLHTNHLVWFEKNGELAKFTSEISPFYYEEPTSAWDHPDWYRTIGLEQGEDGSIYTAASLRYPWIRISKYDSEGLEIWSKLFSGALAGVQADIRALTLHNNQIYFGKQEISTDDGDFNSLIVLDASTGNQVDSIPLPYKFEVKYIHVNSPSDIYLATTFCSQGDCYSAIVAVDDQGEEKWRLTYGDGYPLATIDACYKILPQEDGTFVGIGNYHEDVSDNIEEEGYWNRYIVLFKFNDQGEEIWSRRFHIVESFHDDHQVADVIQTSDRGFAFCGVANDEHEEGENFELPVQQIWVVKTDPCGCLIPGCDPDCNAYPMAPVAEDDYLILGPSPTTGPLNVYLKPFEDPNLELLVHDMTGRVIHSISQAQTDITYMMDLSNQAEGVYLVTLRSEEKVLQMEKVVVTK